MPKTKKTVTSLRRTGRRVFKGQIETRFTAPLVIPKVPGQSPCRNCAHEQEDKDTYGSCQVCGPLLAFQALASADVGIGRTKGIDMQGGRYSITGHQRRGSNSIQSNVDMAEGEEPEPYAPPTKLKQKL